MSFKRIWSLYRRECSSFFFSPLSLVFISVFLVLTGVATFKIGRFFEASQADLTPFFAYHPWLYLLLAPALSMRSWSEEYKTGTVELLLTLPVTIGEVILAKFFALWTIALVALALTFPFVITVFYLGQPDPGPIIVGYLGSALMAAAFLAVGMFVSALTDNQVISFLVAALICLLPVLLGMPTMLSFLSHLLADSWMQHVLRLSFVYHFDALQRGVIDFGDVLYFLSITLWGLLASAMAVHWRRSIN